MYHLLRPLRSRSEQSSLTEFVQALFAVDPLRGLQRAAGEAFAAAGGVAQRDRVRRRIEADLVRAGMRPARFELTSMLRV